MRLLAMSNSQSGCRITRISHRGSWIGVGWGSASGAWENKTCGRLREIAMELSLPAICSVIKCKLQNATMKCSVRKRCITRGSRLVDVYYRHDITFE